MTAPIAYANVADGVQLDGQLFAGKKFWVARKVPHRNGLLQDIQSNGGEIVQLEKQATWLIADHVRPQFCPVGSLSYEFVHKSIAQGRLCDPDDHLVWSNSRPAKGTRAAFTADEDKLLYNWVRAKSGAGALPGGNALYKQLETRHPRHTWQSWRDRYLKHLCHRSPSSFGAPPTPPTAQSTANVPPFKPSSSITKHPATAKPQPAAPETVATEGEYSVNQLIATFTPDDWEMLYGSADVIETNREDNDAWTAWAEQRDNQTPEQWRQYYVKVVRPQWLKDPTSKREQIRKKIERKYHEESTKQIQNVEDGEDLSTTLVAEETTEVNEILTTKQQPLEQSPAAKSKKHLQQDTGVSLADPKPMSSSTARHESPKYITELYETSLKRTREVADTKRSQELAEIPRPAKRRKSIHQSPSPVESAEQVAFADTQQQPLGISSAASASYSSQGEAVEKEAVEEQFGTQPMSDAMQAEMLLQEDIAQTRDIHTPSDSEESDDSDILPRLPRLTQLPEDVVDEVSESIESDVELLARPVLIHRPLQDFQDPPDMEDPNDAKFPAHRPRLQTHEASSDHPSSTSTPRANRTNPAASDTQAIPSSPSQGLIPIAYPDSDASTTQSLQEFRRSLNEHDSQPNTQLPRLPRLAPASPSPAPSVTSATSTDYGDPDPPLEEDELKEFYTAQYADGFTNNYISKALIRTRCRPLLAIDVLEAWGQGLPLPNQRGVWSVEDDEAVQSGDGVVLAMLERKHTLDEWGGITERLNFLRTLAQD